MSRTPILMIPLAHATPEQKAAAHSHLESQPDADLLRNMLGLNQTETTTTTTPRPLGQRFNPDHNWKGWRS